MKFNYIDNISHKNPVLTIPISPTLELSAVLWTTNVTDKVVNARLECLSYALRRLTSRLPNAEIWLIASHKTLQEDNRITRYNGLWKSLQKSGVLIPEGQCVGERVILYENRIRVFDAVRCTIDQIDAIHAVMLAAQTALVILPKTEAIETVNLIVQRGWGMRCSEPPEEALEPICTQGGLVLELYGEFDDIEVSVAAIGKIEVLHALNLD